MPETALITYDNISKIVHENTKRISPRKLPQTIGSRAITLARGVAGQCGDGGYTINFIRQDTQTEGAAVNTYMPSIFRIIVEDQVTPPHSMSVTAVDGRVLVHVGEQEANTAGRPPIPQDDQRLLALLAQAQAYKTYSP